MTILTDDASHNCSFGMEGHGTVRARNREEAERTIEETEKERR